MLTHARYAVRSDFPTFSGRKLLVPSSSERLVALYDHIVAMTPVTIKDTVKQKRVKLIGPSVRRRNKASSRPDQSVPVRSAAVAQKMWAPFSARESVQAFAATPSDPPAKKSNR